MLRFEMFNRPMMLSSDRSLARAVPIIVAGAAVLIGGCSADFLRFDAPVFALNGDKTALAKVEPATDNSLHASRNRDRDLGAGDSAAAGVPYESASNATSRQPEALHNNRNDAGSADVPSVAHQARPAQPALNRDQYNSESSNTSLVTTGALPPGQSVTVQPGDTLYQLSRRYGVSVAAIRQANGLTGNTIRPGQTLEIPVAGRGPAPGRPRRPARTRSPATNSVLAGETYTVQPGDSLYAISRRTGVSVSALQQINGITDVRNIKPGRRLSLGGGVGARTQVAARTSVAPRSEITPKTIRTVPIARPNSRTAAPDGTPQPTILNQRPMTPIATKPKQRVAVAGKAPSSDKFRWPARGRIIASFNHSAQGVKNDGIKIALPLGTEIAAAHDGVVAYSGSELKGYGNLVLVRHDNGWVSAYAHASQILVSRGDRVKRGQTIAKVGRTGDVTQPQLHFELRKGAKPVNPVPHLVEL